MTNVVFIRKNYAGRYDVISEFVNIEFGSVEEAERAYPRTTIVVRD